jgi:hypothetical protein
MAFQVIMNPADRTLPMAVQETEDSAEEPVATVEVVIVVAVTEGVVSNQTPLRFLSGL